MNLILPIPQLLQHPRRTPLPHKSRLHRRRTAHKHFCILLPLRRNPDLLQQLLRHIPLSIRRICHWVAHRVHGLEPVGELLFKLLKFLLQEHILVRVDAKDERDGRLVLRVAENALRELVDRRDACAAGDEGDVVVAVGLPLVALYGEGEEELLAWCEGVDVCALLAVWVLLYHEFEVSGVICLFG